MQTLTRSMPDLHKTLVLASITQDEHGEYRVEEMAIATEHAPFRHKKQQATPNVGSQVKKPKTTSHAKETNVSNNDLEETCGE